ncbi:rhombotarget A [Acinetobacter sp. S40]|uniref:rhombotarget A n=1 Tax=unclassified Acinetobacter TaxID=196816 RepID=UPI00190CD785|nr:MULTISPECIES: rhombotarget A [unclassified Acinetobacter]MBJ9986365.1 rhombotarget A [Acinetobacter sp. S40]MBK0063638.1 rhombotarget A [Acinetobacter sp. S55]MBK0067516.1 rhombotarget A [Acinetobacter sp. S54]
MLKRGIGVGLLFVAGHAYSAGEIIVNTTADEVKNDNLCSLREAIEYINQGMPEAGYNGCGGEDSTAVVLLEKQKTYELNSQIKIQKALQLKTTYDTDVSNNQYGKNNATIKMVGNDRIFYVYDDNSESAQYSVSLIEVNLDGNPESTVNNGGLIFNRETLNLQYVKLTNGHASVNGGAIYNEGVSTDTNVGYVTASNVIFQNNTAPQGAVIYSELPYFNIYQTVIRDNKATSSTLPTLIYSAIAFDDDSTSANASSRYFGLKNSTIFSNTGYITNVRDGMIVNNITMIRNSMGLYLQGPKGDAYVSNSIIVENGSKNCVFAADDKTNLINNLTNTSMADCGSGTATDPNVNVANNKLLAGELEGKCDAAPADGLLCPYYTPENQFLGFFKPRLLMSYKTLADSLIVNRGRVLSNGTNITSLSSCEASDQRGKTRSTKELCDIGAIELVIDADSISPVGQDILYGETAKFSIADQLADGELLPASECEGLLGKRDDGKAWQAGCLQIVQTNTPSKGTLTLDQEGNITYVPNGNWHGSDEFKLRIMTTITRFSDSVGSQYIDIPAKIVQDPPNDFESKKVKTSGGSFGYGMLIALLGLVGLRRFKK